MILRKPSASGSGSEQHRVTSGIGDPRPVAALHILTLTLGQAWQGLQK